MKNIRILLKILLSLCGQNPIGGIGIWEPELTWVNFLRQKKEFVISVVGEENYTDWTDWASFMPQLREAYDAYNADHPDKPLPFAPFPPDPEVPDKDK